MSRAHLRIFGKVQGVYFRVTAARQSKTLGLRGWVRNRRNGSVETVVEGEDDVVERYVAWCHQGPSMARVDTVEITRGEPVGLGEGFYVRPTE